MCGLPLSLLLFDEIMICVIFIPTGGMSHTSLLKLSVDSSFQTPLHDASHIGMADIVTILLSKGANIHEKDVKNSLFYQANHSIQSHTNTKRNSNERERERFAKWRWKHQRETDGED